MPEPKAEHPAPAGYISLAQAGRLLGVSQLTLLRWRRKRRVPLPQQIGRRLCWKVGELERWRDTRPRVTVAGEAS